MSPVPTRLTAVPPTLFRLGVATRRRGNKQPAVPLVNAPAVIQPDGIDVQLQIDPPHSNQKSNQQFDHRVESDWFQDHSRDLIDNLARWSMQLDRRESELDHREQEINRRLRLLRQT